MTGTCPENSLLLCGAGRGPVRRTRRSTWRRWPSALRRVRRHGHLCQRSRRCSANKEEYEAFRRPAHVPGERAPRCRSAPQCGPVHIGIDAGSTTVKAGGHRREEPDPVHQLSAQPRQPAAPDPGAAARTFTRSTRACRSASVTTTGYGEELVKNAFRVRFRRGGDGGPLHGGQVLYAGRGFHHRHRRPGHEVLQDRGRRHQTTSS